MKLSCITYLLILILSIFSCGDNNPNIEFTKDEIAQLKRYDVIMNKYNLVHTSQTPPIDIVRQLDNEDKWLYFEKNMEDVSYEKERIAYGKELMKLYISPKIMEMPQEDQDKFYRSINYENGKTILNLYDFVLENNQYFLEEDIAKLKETALQQ